MLSPIKDTVEWFKAGINFGYRTVVLAIDAGAIYGALYVGSKMIKSCSHEDKGKLETKIEKEYTPQVNKTAYTLRYP